MKPTKTKNNKKEIKALLQRVQRETSMNDILRTRMQTLQHRNANDAEMHDRFVAENRILQAKVEELQQAVLLATSMKDTAAQRPKDSNKIRNVFQNSKKAALRGATVVPRGKIHGGDGRRVEQTTKKIRKPKPSKATTWQQKSCGNTNAKTKLPNNMTKATKPTANPQRLGRKRNAPEEVNQQQQQRRETTKPTKKRKTVLPPRKEAHLMYKCPVQGCTHVIPFAESLHPPLYHGDDSRHAVSDQVVWDARRFQSQIQMARSHMRQQHKDMNASAWPLAFQQHVPLAALSKEAAAQPHVGSTTVAMARPTEKQRLQPQPFHANACRQQESKDNDSLLPHKKTPPKTNASLEARLSTSRSSSSSKKSFCPAAFSI